MIVTYCIKRGKDIPMKECDCDLFWTGWYHSKTRATAMSKYNEKFANEMRETTIESQQLRKESQ